MPWLPLDFRLRGIIGTAPHATGIDVRDNIDRVVVDIPQGIVTDRSQERRRETHRQIPNSPFDSARTFLFEFTSVRRVPAMRARLFPSSPISGIRRSRSLATFQFRRVVGIRFGRMMMVGILLPPSSASALSLLGLAGRRRWVMLFSRRPSRDRRRIRRYIAGALRDDTLLPDHARIPTGEQSIQFAVVRFVPDAGSARDDGVVGGAASSGRGRGDAVIAGSAGGGGRRRGEVVRGAMRFQDGVEPGERCGRGRGLALEFRLGLVGRRMGGFVVVGGALLPQRIAR
mmetsp:Transcript_12476/g.26886  ORF Transcript_12476/g.26886 Transcript_12476/m.26886 type:complete len:286 (-) Transcript_12476:111-968(-)